MDRRGLRRPSDVPDRMVPWPLICRGHWRPRYWARGATVTTTRLRLCLRRIRPALN